MSLEEILDQYCEHFNVDGFPFFAFRSATEEELIEMMKTAIEKNEVVKPKYDSECDY